MLEKILEDIDVHAIEFEAFGTSDDYISVGWVKDIIRKHMNDGWIPVEERLPDESDGMVLVQVSGKPKENITLDNAYGLGCYIPDGNEGWILDEYPDWENPGVIAWQPLPELYRPKKED